MFSPIPSPHPNSFIIGTAVINTHYSIAALWRLREFGLPRGVRAGGVAQTPFRPSSGPRHRNQLRVRDSAHARILVLLRVHLNPGSENLDFLRTKTISVNPNCANGNIGNTGPGLSWEVGVEWERQKQTFDACAGMRQGTSCSRLVVIGVRVKLAPRT
jgi:hypothetical protein